MLDRNVLSRSRGPPRPSGGASRCAAPPRPRPPAAARGPLARCPCRQAAYSGMLWSPAVCGRLHTRGGGGHGRHLSLTHLSCVHRVFATSLERRAPCVFRRNRSAPGRPERREVCAVEDLADSTFRSGSQSHKSRLVGVEFPLLLWPCTRELLLWRHFRVNGQIMYHQCPSRHN